MNIRKYVETELTYQRDELTQFDPRNCGTYNSLVQGRIFALEDILKELETE